MSEQAVNETDAPAETQQARTADPIRDEMLAITRVGKAIAGLTLDGQQRVLGYVQGVMYERIREAERSERGLRFSKLANAPMASYDDTAKVARSNGL